MPSNRCSSKGFALGVYVVAISRIRRALESTYAGRFLLEIYTALERADCEDRPDRLAARFAGKEAVSKALGTGFSYMARGGVAPVEIEILADARGKPTERLHGRARARAEELQLTEWEISLSHAGDLAVAFVAGASADLRSIAGMTGEAPDRFDVEAAWAASGAGRARVRAASGDQR